jgi:predicted HD superfamily hydrolase involved in NAD metabolism
MDASLTDKAWECARRLLSEERLVHTQGAQEEARRLAPLFGADPGKAALAAVLHDIARGYGPQELLRAAQSKGIMVRRIDRLRPILLHGKISAAIAAECGVRDEDVLRAIASHVTGRPGWTSLEQVVYLADKTERGRDYPGVERLRTLIRSGRPREALREALRNAITHAARNGPELVDPETVVVFNEVSQGLAQAPEH